MMIKIVSEYVLIYYRSRSLKLHLQEAHGPGPGEQYHRLRLEARLAFYRANHPACHLQLRDEELHHHQLYLANH